MPSPGLDARTIRRLRAAKPTVDPWQPHGVLDELERALDDELSASRTIFLAGAECPFTCVFCDLWRYTTDRPTPDGALPRQIEIGLEELPTESKTLKLYNASNFFDPHAVPAVDLPQIAALTCGFERLVVECHPRLVDHRAADFARRVDGRLELALGLETANPDTLARLNKGMDLADFDRACQVAADAGLGLRTFLLVGSPYEPVEQRQGWVVRSVEYAIARGVEHIALIPVRGGNGALEDLEQRGDFVPPTLAELERTFSAALETAAGRAVVGLDLWDLERHLDCEHCGTARRAALETANHTGQPPAAVACGYCAGSRR